MEQARLITLDDGFVADVDIPPFDPPADGLMWGSRFFKFDMVVKREGRVYVQYREGMLFYVAPV